MTKLENQIKEASQKYYTDGTSSYTDEEFDRMTKELRKEDPDSPILKQTGWGYDVNKDSTPGEKIPHKYGLAGSLDKAYSWEEIQKSLKRKDVQVSLKLDGLSVVLYYEYGRLARALTRGNGEVGIDITDKIRYILPEEIDDKLFTGAVRGEILMDGESWKEYKKRHPEAKNSRNSAAGIINSKDVSEDIYFLSIVVYTIMGHVRGSLPIYYITYMNHWLEKNFKKVVPSKMIYDIDRQNISDFPELAEDLNKEHDYPIDGLVIKNMKLQYDSDTYEVKYDAQAFKFSSEVAESPVLEVEWNMTKTNYLMPRVRIAPVELSGTIVQYCTGYNAKFIKDNEIGVDSIVEVEKHGEIIPNINKVIKSSKSILPKICPVCHQELVWDGVHLKCNNEFCGNAARQDLSVWIENIAPIDGLGDKIKFKFLDMMFSKDLNIETLMLNNSMEYIQDHASGHKKLIYDMLDMLYNRKDIPMSDALKALNIPRLGDKTCDRLSKYPDIIDEVLALSNASDRDDRYIYMISSKLSSVIGEANAKSILDNLRKFNRLNLIFDRVSRKKSPRR